LHNDTYAKLPKKPATFHGVRGVLMVLLNTTQETSFSSLFAIPNPVVVCWPSPLALLDLLPDFELIDLVDLQGTPFFWTPMPESIC
jgi:hypothetical protein